MNNYLVFQEFSRVKKKTIRVVVRRKANWAILGEITFWLAWRKYVFVPENLTLFDADCLNDISSKLTQMNKEIQAEWQARRKKVEEANE
ncbi:hypothetical protein [Enterococcus sp. DIV1420a]|uniref:hypothetical protein n=1 Tax=Enterococcus sp. DIV1420a TaxID=2774672 RepID=UPI003F231F45